jgi:hypothetical protein
MHEQRPRSFRLENEDVLDRMAERLKARPAILDRRREVVEHPFGSIKQWVYQGALLMRSLANVRAEFSMTGSPINRALHILGVEAMTAAVVAHGGAAHPRGCGRSGGPQAASDGQRVERGRKIGLRRIEFRGRSELPSSFTDVPGLPGHGPAFIGGFCVSGASNSSAHRIGRGSPNSSGIAPIARNGKAAIFSRAIRASPERNGCPSFCM